MAWHLRPPARRALKTQVMGALRGMDARGPIRPYDRLYTLRRNQTMRAMAIMVPRMPPIYTAVGMAFLCARNRIREPESGARDAATRRKTLQLLPIESLTQARASIDATCVNLATQHLRWQSTNDKHGMRAYPENRLIAESERIACAGAGRSAHDGVRWKRARSHRAPPNGRRTPFLLK